MCSKEGEGLAKDVMEAVKWFRKAADQGLASAEFMLGACFKEGKGVSKNAFQAWKWNLKAKDQGHAGAQYSLGVCYKLGEGVAQDLVISVILSPTDGDRKVPP